MPQYKGTVKFTSCAVLYFEADDQAAADAHMSGITEAELRAETEWKNIFIGITEQEVVSVEEE